MKGFRAVTSDVRRAGTDLGKGFWQMTVAVVAGNGNTQKRREGSHHWIARRGCVALGGYRSPIGLEGGSRLRISDPRSVHSPGRRGYGKPISPSVDNSDENLTPGTPGANRAGGPS